MFLLTVSARVPYPSQQGGYGIPPVTTPALDFLPFSRSDRLSAQIGVGVAIGIGVGFLFLIKADTDSDPDPEKTMIEPKEREQTSDVFWCMKLRGVKISRRQRTFIYGIAVSDNSGSKHTSETDNRVSDVARSAFGRLYAQVD